MRILHIADLHLGKTINGYKMIEDQKYILKEIMKIIEKENVEAVIMAGDIYDRGIPPEEAVNLFNKFLEELNRKNKSSFIISGNHDSAERLSFGGEIMQNSGIYISYPYDGTVRTVRLEDDYGKINFHLIPFIKPIHVRKAHSRDDIEDYTDAMKVLIEEMKINKNERNIAVSHQFVTGAARSDSEEISIGGLDNIDSETYESFDYTALGHIHGAQKCGSENIRYAGSILKYAVTEHKKSVTLVEIKEKGNIEIEKIPLKPVREMREIKGTFQEIMENSENDENRDDYISVILTDDEEGKNTYYKLKDKYKNLMSISYDNKRTRRKNKDLDMEYEENKNPVEYCKELFKEKKGKDMTENQKKILTDIFEELKEA